MAPSNIEQEISRVVNNCIEFAKLMLNESREFYPFAAQLSVDNKIIPTSFSDGDEFPKSQTILDGLKQQLDIKLKNKLIICYSIAFDGRVKRNENSELSDAIIINVEHIELQETYIKYYPYLFSKKNELIFGEPWSY